MKKLLMVLPVALVTACTPAKLPEKQRYTLNRASHQVVARLPRAVTLQVNSIVAAPAFQNKDMIYLEKDYQLKSFAHNEWVAPPGLILTPLVVESLRASQAFKEVLPPLTTGKADYRVDLQLLSLQQSFTPQASTLDLVLTAQIIDLSNRKPIGTQRFEIHEPCKSRDPYGGVLAANQAVEQALGNLVLFTREVVAKAR